MSSLIAFKLWGKPWWGAPWAVAALLGDRAPGSWSTGGVAEDERGWGK